MPFERELEFARRAAVRAGENALRIRAAGITAETKPDDTPVTLADRDNERLLGELIEAEFPLDGILGEEGARKSGASGRRWILDPIDGTRDFVRGNRFWCVLIALEEGGDPVVGVAHFPMLGETYWASRGAGAFRDGERLHVSQVSRIPDAVVCPNGMHHDALKPFAAAMMEFLTGFWAVRSAGGALDAAMLAAGQVDVWFEGKASLWDLAPLKLLIEEAGGRYFALDGSNSAASGSAIACAPGLEREVREFFGLA